MRFSTSNDPDFGWSGFFLSVAALVCAAFIAGYLAGRIVP